MLTLKGFVKVMLAARVTAPACPQPHTAPEPQGLPGGLCGPTRTSVLCVYLYTPNVYVYQCRGDVY